MKARALKERQNPVGAVKDCYTTPPELVDAIENALAVQLLVDAACESHNMIHTALRGMCVNNGIDAFACDWHGWLHNAMIQHTSRMGVRSYAVFVNPPFSQMAHWAPEVYRQHREGQIRIIMVCTLDPSVGWWDWVDSRDGETRAARVLMLRGRCPYLPPKGSDLPDSGSRFTTAVVDYLPGWRGAPQYSTWDWRRDVPTAANDNGGV